MLNKLLHTSSGHMAILLGFAVLFWGFLNWLGHKPKPTMNENPRDGA